MEHFDLAAFYGGSATELYRTLGAHRTPDGWVFRVWAPHAGSVSVVGDFCAWDPTAHPMRRLDGGIWETEAAGLSPYDTYKFAVTAQSGGMGMAIDCSRPCEEIACVRTGFSLRHSPVPPNAVSSVESSSRHVFRGGTPKR